MANILVLHGPNLNLLGEREPDTYGSVNLDTINHTLVQQAQTAGHQVTALQSNSEAELVSTVQTAPSNKIDFILINAAALTHTSIALRDAFLAVKIPFIEVHLSNIYQRETFRHQSYLAGIARGCISGFGPLSYELALTAAIKHVA